MKSLTIEQFRARGEKVGKSLIVETVKNDTYAQITDKDSGLVYQIDLKEDGTIRMVSQFKRLLRYKGV